MDYIEKIIKDLRDGAISETYATNLMEFKQQSIDVQQNQRQRKLEWKIAPALIDEYQKEYGLSPEEILIEREKKLEVINFLEEVYYLIGPYRWKIFTMYYVSGFTLESIAERYGGDKAGIKRKLDTILSKINKLISQKKYKHLKELLSPPQSQLEANSPEKSGWPNEIFEKANNGAYWEQKKDGTKGYIPKVMCKTPEYLQSSYHDNKSICTKCDDRCTRLDDNCHMSVKIDLSIPKTGKKVFREYPR